MPWRRGSGPPDSITVNGKKYTFYWSYKSKKQAKDNARALREEGQLAMVRPYHSVIKPTEYALYTRRKK